MHKARRTTTKTINFPISGCMDHMWILVYITVSCLPLLSSWCSYSYHSVVQQYHNTGTWRDHDGEIESERGNDRVNISTLRNMTTVGRGTLHSTKPMHVSICDALMQFGYYQTHVWMGLKICGALVQFGCYQHRHEWMWRPSSILNYHTCITLLLLIYRQCHVSGK